MEFKFSKGATETSPQDAEGAKKKQQLQLLVLLIIIGGFSYVYFMTDLIRPREASPPPAPVQQVVKQAMPPREGDAPKPASEGEKAPVPAEAKPEQPKATKAEPIPPVPPRPEPPKKAEPPVKAEPAVKPASPPKAEPAVKPVAEKPAGKKEPVAGKKPEVKAPASQAKAAVAPTPPAPKKAQGDAKPAVAVDTQQKAAPKKDSSRTAERAGAWSVVIGNYLLEDALSADLARLRKAGFSPKIVPGEKKKNSMNRLLLGEYRDRAAAQAELEKLRKHTSDAFILDLGGGKFGVFAGSYLLDARAASEKERLGAAGFTLTVRKVELSMSTRSLALEGFSDKKSAEAALVKVKEAGLSGVLRR